VLKLSGVRPRNMRDRVSKPFATTGAVALLLFCLFAYTNLREAHQTDKHKTDQFGRIADRTHPRQRSTGAGYTQEEIFAKVAVKDVKRFWDAKPCNSGWHFPGLEQGTKEWFSAVKERRYRVEPHSVEFAGFAEAAGKNVLEIGGGICTDSMSFAQNGANVTIVDLSTESLKLCRRRFELFGLPQHIFQGSAMELDTFLPAMKFDIIYSYGVIHHMPNPAKCVCQLSNYLMPGGQARIMLYTKFSYKLFEVMHDYGDWDIARLDSIIAEYSETQVGSPVTYTYTIGEATEMFEKCGFRVQRIWKDHVFKYDLDSYHKGKLVVRPEFQGMNAKTWKQMTEELGWHLMVHATLK